MITDFASNMHGLEAAAKQAVNPHLVSVPMSIAYFPAMFIRSDPDYS